MIKYSLFFIVLLFLSPPASAADKRDNCHFHDGRLMTFEEYYYIQNHRSVHFGHQLWGGAPDTPNDLFEEVEDRVLNTFGRYADCINKAWRKQR